MGAAQGTDWQEAPVVIKLGGELLTRPHPLSGLMADVVALRRAGLRVVLVHGGGPQADVLAAALGHVPRKVDGRRITTDTDLDIATYLYGGALNLTILAELARLGAKGMRVCGLDGGLFKAVRRPPVTRTGPDGTSEVVDFGHVGDLTGVDSAVLSLLLAADMVPVVAPLADDGAGGILNVNADTVATAVAIAIGASRLVLLTNVPGIMDANRAVLPTLTAAAAERLIADGTINGGMIPKVHNALYAVRQGIGGVHVMDGRAAVSPLLGLLAEAPSGTMFTAAAPARPVLEESHG